MVDEITGASREQSAGIEQVTQAITQMDEITQQNAALVEQAAAAAESLEDQTRVLAQAVSVFRIKDSGKGAAPIPVSSPQAALSKAATPMRTTKPMPTAKRQGPAANNPDEWEEF